MRLFLYALALVLMGACEPERVADPRPVFQAGDCFVLKRDNFYSKVCPAFRIIGYQTRGDKIYYEVTHRYLGSYLYCDVFVVKEESVGQLVECPEGLR